MAHKKGVGSSKNGRESESKRLGVKLFGGEFAKAGNIIVRQRGTSHHVGENVGIGRDHTIYALIDGTVVFRKSKNNRSYISVKSLPVEPANMAAQSDFIEPSVTVEAVGIVETVEAAEAVEAVEVVKAIETPETETIAENQIIEAEAVVESQ